MKALRCGLAFAAASFVMAQNPKMLVSTDELAKALHDPSLVILHVGSAEDYNKGHIPGARLVTLADISITDDRGMRVQLPAVEQLARAMEALGISDDSRVVIYPAAESIQSATRVWFTLDYLGAGSTAALLDGGLLLWKQQGRPVTTDPAPPPKTRTHFTARANPSRVVDASWVSGQLRTKQIRIVDARLPEFYTGANAGGMSRAGHLPGAVSVPYTSLLDDERRLRTPEELGTALMPGSGQTIVTYCHIGMQATVPYFVARYLGINVKLYDGSFQDWSSRPDLPVESGAR